MRITHVLLTFLIVAFSANAMDGRHASSSAHLDNGEGSLSNEMANLEVNNRAEHSNHHQTVNHHATVDRHQTVERHQTVDVDSVPSPTSLVAEFEAELEKYKRQEQAAYEAAREATQRVGIHAALLHVSPNDAHLPRLRLLRNLRIEIDNFRIASSQGRNFAELQDVIEGLIQQLKNSAGRSTQAHEGSESP